MCFFEKNDIKWKKYGIKHTTTHTNSCEDIFVINAFFFVSLIKLWLYDGKEKVFYYQWLMIDRNENYWERKRNDIIDGKILNFDRC